MPSASAARKAASRLGAGLALRTGASEHVAGAAPLHEQGLAVGQVRLVAATARQRRRQRHAAAAAEASEYAAPRVPGEAHGVGNIIRWQGRTGSRASSRPAAAAITPSATLSQL